METVSYLLILVVGILLAAWGYHLNLGRLERALPRRALAWLTLLLGSVLAFVLSKLVYVAFRQEVFSLHGAAGLIRMNPEEFSFVGGCLGFVLGGILAARILRVRVFVALDRMAAPLALGIAFARAAESFLGMLGQGADPIDAEWTHFFPMTVENVYSAWYSEWVLAINLHLAFLALVCVFLALTWQRKCADIPGVCFGRTVTLLCAPLFILELMRAVSVTIFVRVHSEQILCFAVMAACIMAAAVRSRKSAWGIMVPAVLLVLVLGLNVALQFGADGKLNPFVERLPFSEDARDWMLNHLSDWCYPGMILSDIGLVALELVLTRRQLRRSDHVMAKAA